jgi:formamidopyrimidine-DNA glycosylase
MPELPEVQTTASILNTLVKNNKIVDVWTDLDSPYFKGKENIKDPVYFKKFGKEITGKKILKVWRRAKNVLIDIEGDKTILIHMKMTGHLLFGKYEYDKKKNKWTPVEKNSPLADPFNRFIHLVFTLDNGNHIAFSDMRKFASVSLIPDKKVFYEKMKKIGPEPLDDSFDLEVLKERLGKKPNGKVKTILMDLEIIAGIGNIYSDEILWASSVHPERLVKNLNEFELKDILKWMKRLLLKGIDFGGDSMSDYRNPYGERGKFQNEHQAYRKTGQICTKKGCEGIIKRKVVGQRSAHFCSEHQKLK